MAISSPSPYDFIDNFTTPNALLDNIATNVPHGTTTFNISYWEHIFASTLVGIIASLGIFGNSMIITAVAFSRKLQTSTNAFVTSLSVADFLTSLFLIPYLIGLLGKTDWPFPNTEWICAVTGFVMYNCIGASICNLAAISVNRLILITNPLIYRKIFTSWKLAFLVAIPWLIPCSVNVILLLINIGGFGFDKSELSCGDLDSHPHAITFNLAQTLVAIPVPPFLIVVSYTWIYLYLKKHFKRQKANITLAVKPRCAVYTVSKQNIMCENNTSQSNLVDDVHNTNTMSVPVSSVDIDSVSEASFTIINQADSDMNVENGSKASNQNSTSCSAVKCKAISQQQIEITKNLFIVVCAFFACYIPYFLLEPILGMPHVIYYLRLLPLSNCAINFVIYSRKHPEFKVVLGCMMRCQCANIPQPTKLLKFLQSRNI